MTNWYYSGSVTVGIWAKRTAGWQLVTTYTHFVAGGSYSTGGLRSFPFSITDYEAQLGSDVSAVGLTIESFNGESATIDDFTKLSWQAQGTGAGTRSATPNGEQTTVIVSP